jgi:hypothetical protein
MADNDVLIQIRGDVSDINAKLADLKGYIGKVNDGNKDASNSGTAFLQKLKQNWIEVTAAVYAAKKAFDTAMEYIELGAKAQQAEESFRLVSAASKENADQIVSDMKRASAGTVDDSDIMQEAVKGMILGLKGDQLVKIMEIARVAARYAGVDVKTAYEEITNAIGTKMPGALVKYGLITKEEAMKIKQATKQGAEGIDLYGLAMAHADVNVAKFGEINTNAAERIQEHRAKINDIKESLGSEFIEIMARATDAIVRYKGALLGVILNKESGAYDAATAIPNALTSYATSVAVRLSAAIKDAQGKTKEAAEIRALLDKPIEKKSDSDEKQKTAEENLKN